VARILVADDNSNIQRMVGLALKEQGIDVVAVGNGEAAVRKISDIIPDLVLADVFMPVRNGYEVCQYVKSDPKLAHIPVILLVGAFDPLDEQEAQRVGADGVLKKPFVPPDPLISMVKSALARAGVAHGETSAAKTPEPSPLRATDLFAAPVLQGPVPVAQPGAPVAAVTDESFVDDAVAGPEPVRIDARSQPVAFGNLLETPTEEKTEDLAYLAPVNPALGLERDWRDAAGGEESEEEEEEKPAAAWRHEETETPAGSDAVSSNWRSGGFEAILSRKKAADPWEPVEEKPAVQEASERKEDAHAGGTSVPEVQREIPVAPFASDAWAAVTASMQKPSAEETVTALEEAAGAEPHATESAAASSQEPAPTEPEKKSPDSPWFSSPSSPWDSDIQKANRLASAWDSGVAAPPLAEATNGAGGTAELSAASEPVHEAIEAAALPLATVEALREEAAQAAEEAVQAAGQQASDAPTIYVHEQLAPESAPSMDDLVARVLANMNPEVLQAVTREILRPVVEAMVKEELKSKKS